MLAFDDIVIAIGHRFVRSVDRGGSFAYVDPQGFALNSLYCSEIRLASGTPATILAICRHEDVRLRLFKSTDLGASWTAAEGVPLIPGTTTPVTHYWGLYYTRFLE